MSAWDANEFSRKYGGVKIRDGAQLADILREMGHDVTGVTDNGATIQCTLDGREMEVTVTIPGREG